MNLPRWINVALLGVVLLLLVTIFGRFRSEPINEDLLQPTGANSQLRRDSAARTERNNTSRMGPMAEQTQNTDLSDRRQSAPRSQNPATSAPAGPRSARPATLERKPIGFSPYDTDTDPTDNDQDVELREYPGLNVRRTATSRITSG